MAYEPVTCIAVSVTLLVTAWIAVFLRLYSRIFLLSGPFGDDISAICSTVVYTIFVVLFIYGTTHYGLARHMSEIPEQTGIKGIRTILIAQILYVVGTLLVKISFSLTLYRLVQTRACRSILHLVIAIGIVITAVEFFWILFACHSITMFWQHFDLKYFTTSCGSLTSMKIMNMIHGGWIIIADIVLGLVFPGFLLNGLQMSRNAKMSVLFLLGIGSLTIIATAFRLLYISRISFRDPLYSNTPAIFWGVVELSVSIISTAAATWKPILLKIGIISNARNASVGSTSEIPLSQQSFHKRAQLAMHPFMRRNENEERMSSMQSIV